MFAELITIGDELLIGQVVDTNSAWMGRELNNIGIEVLRIVSVRDREEEILEAIDNAMKRVNIVLVTGGLGPTKDDITKQTLCKYFNTELIFSEEVFENVKRVLAGKIPMNKLNKGQAMVPKNCTVINNPVGSASVSWFERDGKVLVSMPGVPQEMTTVMAESVLPKLHERFQTDVIMHQTFLVQHYPESVLAEKLEAWEVALPDCIKLAYLPKLGIIRMRLTGRGHDRKEVETLLNREKAKLETILGEDIFSEEDTPLEVIIGELLKKRKLTVSTAESCTGGSIAERLTSIAGSSEYFKGSIVAYSNEVKKDLLYMSSETLEKYGAVSEETVIEMVKGAMKALKTDCAVATSGIAGPGGGTPEKPVGTVWIAAGYKNEIRTYKQETNRGRAMNIERAGNNALLMLRVTTPALEDAARTAAAQIFSLRRHRIELVTGEAGENVFGEGLKAALEEIDRLEQSYLELFLGKRIVSTETRRYVVCPQADKKQYIVCRFSPAAGLLPDTDLSGDIVLLQIEPSGVAKSDLEAGPKETQVVACRVADPSTCIVVSGGREYARAVLPVFEFGRTINVALPRRK